jgi:hypothetical protein
MRSLVKNKRGAEMTIGTIVIIVLALIVLVVLVVGFTQGWGNLWNWFGNLFGGGNKIDAVVNGCLTACSTKSMNAYCDQMRDVGTKNLPTGLVPGEYNCKALEKITSVGLTSCDAFSSVTACVEKSPSTTIAAATKACADAEINGEWKVACGTETVPLVPTVAYPKEATLSDMGANSGKHCCVKA